MASSKKLAGLLLLLVVASLGGVASAADSYGAPTVIKPLPVAPPIYGAPTTVKPMLVAPATPAAALSPIAPVTRPSSSVTQGFSGTLSIGPRLQWNANDGYCGEVSFISAGMYCGQYCSQFTARALAAPGVAQSRSNSQLLLGVNDTTAAAAMHLSATPWKAAKGNTSKDFLTWTASQILAGRPVAIGVYTNEYLFYKSTSPTAGDPDYDHIVPVIGVSGTAAVTNGGPAYDAASTISFSDNGLWSPTSTPPYIFKYPFGTFQATRQQANAKTGAVYSLPTGGTNYGIAFNGVTDLNKDTVPVSLTTDVNSELPAMKNGSNTAPTASRINLTVTVTIPDQTVEYNLYRYSDFKNVPDSKFNFNVAKSSAHWRITSHVGSTYVLKLSILSSETAVFRAVRVTAP